MSHLIPGKIALLISLLMPPHALANKVLVSNEKSNTITALKSEAWEVLTEFPAGNRPTSITISPDIKLSFEVAALKPAWLRPVSMKVTYDNKWLVLALAPENRVAVTNVETNEVEDNILIGQRVWQLGFMPDQKYLITTNGNSNDVTIIDVRPKGPQIHSAQRATLGVVSPN